jgi:hypothetical protein
MLFTRSSQFKMMTTLRNQRDDKLSYTFHNTSGKTRLLGYYSRLTMGRPPLLLAIMFMMTMKMANMWQQLMKIMARRYCVSWKQRRRFSLVSCLGLSGRQHQKKRSFVNLIIPHVSATSLIQLAINTGLAIDSLGSFVNSK